MLNESLFRMLLELQITSVGRSILFDVARDISNLQSSAQNLTVAQQQIQRAGQTAALAGAGLVAFGAAVTGAFADATAEAANFNRELIYVQNNTGLAQSNMGALRQNVLSLGEATGESFEGLANGFRRAYDLSQDATAATAILNEATKDAVATGADEVVVANTLAQAMHVYGMDTSTAATEQQRLNEIQANAANTMAIIQTAANESNLTLQQFAQGFSIVGSWAASVGVPIQQAAAAFGALSKDVPNAARAGTQVIDLFQHIINPSKAAREEIERISRLSGVDLVDDFSTVGLETRHLTGILDDMHLAYQRLGFSTAQASGETLRMIPNLRGGVGAFLLLGSASGDYARILADTDDRQKNIARDEAAYQTALKSTAQQWEILSRQVQGAKIELGDGFLPVANRIMGNFVPIVRGIGEWAKANQDLLVSIVPLGVALTSLGGSAIALGGLATVLTLNPAIGAGVALLTVSVGALGLAYTTNFLGIRDVTNRTVSSVVRDYNIWADAAKNVSKVVSDTWNADMAESDRRRGGRSNVAQAALGGAQQGFIDALVPAPVRALGEALNFLGQGFDFVTQKVAQFNAAMEPNTRLWGQNYESVRSAERADEEATAALGRQIDATNRAMNHVARLNIEIDNYTRAADVADDASLRLQAAIDGLGAAADQVASELGGLTAMVEGFVDADVGLQNAKAAADGATSALDNFNEQQLELAANSSNSNSALRALERQARVLADEIAKAKQQLQDLAHPDLIDVHPFNQKLSDMAKQIQQLELQRSQMLAGGAQAGSPAVRAVENQIQALQRAAQLTQDQRSVLVSDDMRKINEGIAAATRTPSNGPITFAQAMEQINRIKQELPGWEIQQENVKNQIDQARDAMSETAGNTRAARLEQERLRDAAKDTASVYKEMRTAVEDVATWLGSIGPTMHGQGGSADIIASYVDDAAKQLYAQIQADSKLPPNLAAAAIARDVAAFDRFKSQLAAQSKGLPTANPLPGAGGMGRTGSIAGFAEGGTFIVPGQSSGDGTLVSFFATPGESVSISPRGGGGGLTINGPLATFGGVASAADANYIAKTIRDMLEEFMDAGNRPESAVNRRLPGAR